MKDLVKLSMFCALGKKRGLRSLFASRSFKKIPRNKIEEVLLEVHLFAGFPASIDAFIELKKFFPSAGQLKSAIAFDNRRDRFRRGRRLCKRIYHSNFDRLIDRMESLHPDLARWIIEDGYGKVLSRSGLTSIEREFVAIASLAVLGWQRQLDSHVKGALNIGAPKAHLLTLFRVIAPHISKKRLKTMQAIVNCKEMA